MRVRIALLAELVMAALVSCSPSMGSLQPSGVRMAVVTGGIEPCEAISGHSNGPRYAAGTVTVLRGLLTWRALGGGVSAPVFPSAVAGRATVGLNGTYRFVLPPGQYVLRASYAPDLSVRPFTQVSVRGGPAVRVDVPDMCK